MDISTNMHGEILMWVVSILSHNFLINSIQWTIEHLDFRQTSFLTGPCYKMVKGGQKMPTNWLLMNHVRDLSLAIKDFWNYDRKLCSVFHHSFMYCEISKMIWKKLFALVSFLNSCGRLDFAKLFRLFWYFEVEGKNFILNFKN